MSLCSDRWLLATGFWPAALKICVLHTRIKNQYRVPKLEICRWAALTEYNFTGCIFGDMLFQFPAPQRLKCMAAAIQRFQFGSICPFTA
jgi:hypothetical protein